MNLRPKTKRRLLVLLGIGLVFCGLASVAVVILLQRHERHRQEYRAVAINAYNHGDYRTAADNFARYLGNDRMDSQAIFDYAITRSKLPRADLSNFTEAKDLFKRYLELNPGDLEAEHHLLDIYQQLRYSQEAMDIADQLLAQNPDDVPALSAKLHEMVRDRQYEPALPIAMHLNQLMPDDVQTQGLTYELMWHLQKPAADFIDRADQMLQAHPDDPRYELLRAVAAYWTGDREDATKWLRTAASRTPPDAEFTLMLAGAFDRLGLWTDSRSLLEKNATVPTASLTLKANFVQRLWEIGRYDQALAVLKGLNPADPSSDSNLLGLQALILHDQSKGTEPSAGFQSSLAALQQRTDDSVAIAWVALLSSITGTSSTGPLESIQLCQKARQSDPQNPDACFYLGLAYLRIDEGELALQSLKQCTQMQPEWAWPHLLISRVLMQRAQTTAAAQATEAALQRDPQSAAAQTAFALANYHLLRPGSSTDDLHNVLDFIHTLRKSLADDPDLLAAEVDLLVKSNQKADAINLANAAKPSPENLHQLALLNRSDHLGIEKMLTDRLAQCQSTTSQQMLDQTAAEIVLGNETAARSLISTIATHPTPGWRLAWLQAREALGDSVATNAWEQFADSLPQDPDVQLAAIHSPAVIADRPLMDRTIDRVKAITGEDALEWKIARARWQLGDDSKISANAAAASMSEVVRQAPEYASPQEVWADALIKLGDIDGAMAHLRLALQIEPGNVGISFQLAQLYEEQGQNQDAASMLIGVQENNWLTDPQRIEIARLYRQIGDRSSAIKLLDDQTIHPDDPARDILLAQLHTELGEDDAARQIYQLWMRQTSSPAEIIRAEASFFASHQSLAQARKILTGLDTLSLSPGDKDFYLGEFEANWGDKAAAALEFQNSAHAAMENPRSWLAWAGLELRQRDFNGAFSAATDGLKHLPNDPNLSAMKNISQTLAGLQLDPDDQDLLDALSVDPANEAGVAALNALAGSETAADATVKLKEVADKYPRFFPVQKMVIIRDFQAGQYDPAIDRANRASQLFPIDPEPTRLLSIIYAAAGQWEKAEMLAEEWRNRSLDHPHAADIAIASAQIALNHPERAERQIAWCISSPPVPESPGNEPSGANALELYVRSLCMQNRFEQAWQIVQPYAVGSTQWRHRWLRIVADVSTDAASASRRISQIQPLMPANSVADQVALGEAWYTVARRFDDTDALDKAKSIVEPLTDIANAPTDAWLLLGGIQQMQNDLPAAEHSFAAAVNLAPNLPVAKNNLAMIMLLRNEDAKTAQQLATAAVNQAPANSAIHSTLGEIDQKLNDLDGAKSQFQLAVRLNAQNAEALIGLATVQNKSGDARSAAVTLQQVETVLRMTHPILPAQVRDDLDKLRVGEKPTTTSATGA